MQPEPHTPKRELSDEQLLAQREAEIARIEELIATIERKLEWEISHRDEIIAQEVEEAKENLRTKIKEQEAFREEYEKLEKKKKEVDLQKESLRKETELMAMCLLLSEQWTK